MKVSIFPWIAKKLKQCMAITQDGDTADRAIASGKYVCWKSDMYTANQAINSGDTLSAGSGGNLTAVDDGIANDLNSEIATLNSNMPINQDFLNSEVAVGKYNGTTIYERYFAGAINNPARATDVTLITGMPLPNKILNLSVTFMINNTILEVPDKFIRTYVNDSGNLIVNQDVGNLSRIIAYASVKYFH